MSPQLPLPSKPLSSSDRVLGSILVVIVNMITGLIIGHTAVRFAYGVILLACILTISIFAVALINRDVE